MMKRNLAFVALALAAWVTGSGCTGKNIHRDLGEDTQVLVRQWTLPTHTGFEAGDRGSDFSNPVIFENTLIFGSQTAGLIALYPGMMQVRWVLPIPNGVSSPVVVEKGTLYFGGGDGFLYAVDAENGRVSWRYDMHNPIVSSPTIEGGRAFVTTSDDTVYAFDAGTGKWLWHYRRKTSPVATIHGASSPLIDGNEVMVGLSDGFLVSLSLNDGQLKWERKLHFGNKFTDVDARPVLNNGVLYVPSYDGALYALKRQGGDVIWRFDAGGSKQVVIEDERIYLPSSEGAVYALQKSSSKVLWKFELDDGTPTQLIVTDKYIVVGSSFQYLYLIDKNTGKGVYRYSAGWGSGFYGSPAFDPSKQKFYILSQAGNLYSFSFRAQLDEKRWSKRTKDGYVF